jgi:hypothetical protein
MHAAQHASHAPIRAQPAVAAEEKDLEQSSHQLRMQQENQFWFVFVQHVRFRAALPLAVCWSGPWSLPVATRSPIPRAIQRPHRASPQGHRLSRRISNHTSPVCRWLGDGTCRRSVGTCRMRRRGACAHMGGNRAGPRGRTNAQLPRDASKLGHASTRDVTASLTP